VDGGAIWILAASEDEKRISSAVLESAGISEADADAETSRSSFVELVGQAVSGLCQALSGKLQREVTASAPVTRDSGVPADLETVNLIIDLASGKASLIVAATKELIEALAPAKPRPAGPVSEAPARTLDLLFDVELPVSVSFGRAQLPLKDIIKLTSGSIVELNRAISEPVEIIVNNCVIARGDVVVIEGNYGVRIQQVISRQERLRTLT
jgi:flagellar motor switch protein FliN/FliY